MARSVTLGNGNVLVGFDYRGQVRDLYYPFVGQTNHISGASGNFVHRIGIHTGDAMVWLDDPTWTVTVGAPGTSVIGAFLMENATHSVVIQTKDIVHNEQNVLVRNFTITNTAPTARTLKFYVSQQFRIAESRRGDTALYDPRVGAIIHYKDNDTFLVNATCDGVQFSEYNIGLFGIEGKEGTFYDAYDGILEKNPIEHGSVDSIIGFTCELESGASTEIDYWIVCADSIPAVHALDEYVRTETPERLIRSVDAYWQAWLTKQARNISVLPTELQTLYYRSLAIMRVHTDNRGGIIASSDTDMLHHGRDTYSYVWPRDAALIAHAFDVSGYHEVAERFFKFIATCQEPDGYVMHKYLTDGSLGSSWHPWMQNGVPKLPIQEDETATLLVMLWKHYELVRDVEYIESLYNTFIEPAARFISEYIEPVTGLPQGSFDLWEEKYGTSTYTTASVYAALVAATKFASLLGKENDARTYTAIAQRMLQAIETYLYDDSLGMFVKQVRHNDDGDLEYDKTIDTSSLYGVLLFEVFEVDDPRIVRSVQTVTERLQVSGESRGFVRYERDNYYTLQTAGTPNPWVITTLWIARYYISAAKRQRDLKQAFEILEWTASHAAPGGTLAEQMNPHTREHLSTAPLVWSHAEYVLAINAYLDALETLPK